MQFLPLGLTVGKTFLLFSIIGLYILYPETGILLYPETGILRAQDHNESAFRIGRLQYRGGGDWYNDPSGEPNLLRFVRQNTNIDVNPVYEPVDIMSDRLFGYPMIFMTGHGNIVFNEQEVQRLREYFRRGGFLYADDDYGMDAAFRREMRRIFPDQELTELPFSHPLYRSHFTFTDGPPKIHEHDGNPPQGFGLFMDGRLVVFYTYESNPGDGWVDPAVHNNPPELRELALRFGTNIIVWLLTES
jgi:hypothetical protein